jgi:branched-chain amino acid transport system permease protein
MNRRSLGLAAAMAALVLLAALPAVAMPYHVRVGQLFLLSAGLALAWHILGGFAGYWSFGHTAFVGIGAFAAGLLHAHLPMPPLASFAVGTLLGAAASAAFAAVIAYPVLRLRGIYFAIALLGVSQVLGELSQNVDAFQGALGLNLPDVAPESMRPESFFYYCFLVLAAGIFALAAWLRQSRLGYGLASIREDEDTARMLGVPTERFKVIAFVLSAALTGAIGAVYAYSLGYFTSGSVFRVDFSLNMILHALLGGIGTLTGPVIGAALLVFVTNVLLGRLLDLHLLVTGVLVVALVLLAPSGLLGLVRDWQARRRSGP